MEKFLSRLNKEQKIAVKSQEKSTLVLAGAGSGKTSVLTSRIAYLVSLGVEPRSILAMTFTNKASKEMKSRILSMVENLELEEPIYPNDFTIGTFHGFCHKLLRIHNTEAGVSNDFTVLDSDDSRKLIKEVIIDMGYCDEIEDKKERTKEITKITKSAEKLIGYYKDEAMKPDDVIFTREDFNYYGFEGLEIYKAYENEKYALKALDYGDLLLYVVDMFKTNKRLLGMYRDIYRHILVDEFQDTNTVQSLLVDMLYNPKESYLFVVGDDDQSIYEWRGANITNILNFSNKYEGTKIIRLEQNYRSTNNILNCANGLIKHNKNRMGKELWSAKEEGSLIEVNEFFNAYDEADKIAKEIKSKVKQGVPANDFAVLYRTNRLSRIIESKLNEQQLPYTIIGGTGFWSRMEIKDLMGYLTLSVNPSNNMAFDKVVNLPSRKIGAKKLEQIGKYSKENKISRFEALKVLVDSKQIKGEAAIRAKEFINLIEETNNKELDLVEKVKTLVEKTGLIDHYLEKDGEEKGEERVENLNELITAAMTFKPENPDLDIPEEFAFIDYAILQTNSDKETDGLSVQLMTIHAAKGLEFKNVYLIGWEDGTFPSENAIRENRLEEERRLAYVAITRAEENLKISFVNERFPRTPITKSRFVFELPKNIIKETKQSMNDKFNGGFNKFGGYNNFGKKSNYYNENKTDKFKPIPAGYKSGQIYRHDKFGKGIILTSINDGDRIKITVNFSGMIGMKTLYIERKN